MRWKNPLLSMKNTYMEQNVVEKRENEKFIENMIFT